MPQHIVPLNKKKHASITFDPNFEDYSFTSSLKVMPLLIVEAMEAAACFPIVFSRGPLATPCALLGLEKGNNFVNSAGHWLAEYVPLFASNYPFSLITPSAKEENEKPEPILGIDEDAPHFKQSTGQPLYENGEPSPLLARIAEAMGKQSQLYKNDHKLLSQLAISGVLREEPVRINIDGKIHAVSGLCVANRELVMKLSEKVLGNWVHNGLLQLMHAHWWSLRNLRSLLLNSSSGTPVA